MTVVFSQTEGATIESQIFVYFPYQFKYQRTVKVKMHQKEWAQKCVLFLPKKHILFYHFHFIFLTYFSFIFYSHPNAYKKGRQKEVREQI